MPNVLIPLVPVGLVLGPEERRRASEACREALERGADLGPDPATWPDYWRDVFEERSAICEFSGGLTRAEAERLAETCARREHARLAGDAGSVAR